MAELPDYLAILFEDSEEEDETPSTSEDETPAAAVDETTSTSVDETP